ncbi:MAG: sensor histidine kinase [Cyclobacteriaceae bacterium]
MKNQIASFLLLLLVSFTAIGQTVNLPLEISDHLEVIHSDQPDTIKFQAYNQLLDYFNSKDPSKTRQLLNEALTLATESKSDLKFAAYLLKLGRFLEYNNQPDSAFQIFEKSLKLYTKLKNNNGIGHAWKNIAFLEKSKGNYDLAVADFKKSQDYYLADGDSTNYYLMTANLGLSYENQGKYQQASEWYIKGLRYFDSKNDIRQSALFMNNLGAVFSFMNNTEEALRYHKSALKLRLQLQDSFLIAQSFVNIGQNYIHLNYLDSAKKPTEDAYRIFTDIGHLRGASIALSNIALIAQYEGDTKKSIETNLETIKLTKKTSDNYQLAISYLNMGAPLVANDQLDLCQLYMDSCLVLSKKMNSYLLLTNVYESLAEIKLIKGQYKEAYELKEIHRAYKDSLLNKENSENVNNLKMSYETEKKDNEIKTLKTESELKELQIAQTQTLVIAISAIALLVLILIILYNRQRRLKLLAQMAQEKEQLQKERFRVVIDTEENERKRVARELHDGLGQMLSTVRLFVSDLDETNEDPKVERSLKALDSTIEEVRNISHNMMPIKLMELGLPAALEDMAKRVNESGKLNMEVVNSDLLSFGETESIALYRTIQEVINNSIKYAKADIIKVQIMDSGETLLISIKDDGQGFNTENIAKSKGIGWSNIYARMELIGATVRVSSTAKSGTTVTLEVPKLDEAKAA